MGVKVHVNLSGLNRKLSAESLKRARKLMANDALQAMNKYVPSSSQGNDESGSTLRGMSSVAEDGSSVMYRAIYARAQFYGFITNKYGGTFRIHNYTTPGTSRRWDLRLKGHKEDMNHVKEAFVKGLDLK
ncbi:minor capsid protein [Lactobacillus crispatus]|uniref:minor capsid protein n=1 Tax=Lactobacillus crispatus TaxID=47770 RepID=UPI001CC8084C|nr:minor capsid protein [Lactobacillus crispatus]UAY39856.1 minor capsid protein [Lactobacillus crispatus]